MKHKLRQTAAERDEQQARIYMISVTIYLSRALGMIVKLYDFKFYQVLSILPNGPSLKVQFSPCALYTFRNKDFALPIIIIADYADSYLTIPVASFLGPGSQVTDVSFMLWQIH